MALIRPTDHYVTRLFVTLFVLGIFMDDVHSKALRGKPNTSADDGQSTNPLIIISFDGFRWDYLTRTDTPNFDRFLENGVTARYGLKNAFVTKTFPNHFTLATGLWEESHGIVANDMYDPVLNTTFHPGNVSANDDPAWFNMGAEPIWVTNQLQTLNGRSGVIMWVGGGALIKWVTPSRFIPYNSSIKNETKVDMLISWFKDTYPINLGMIYFDQPDGFGHTYGPDSPQVTGMIRGLDTVVGYLLKQLEENGLLDSMNIILTSDHGFTNTPAEKMINLDSFIDRNAYNMYAASPIASIWPHEGKLDEIYQNLTAAAKINGNFTVYKREEVPAHFHYTNNRRIPPVMAVANDTFSFCTGSCVHRTNGDHGYDNSLQDMHPFFLAMGPSFKKNFSVDTFDNVDVYPLMCHLLGIVPAPNNGSLDVVSQLLVLKDEDFRIIIVTYVFLTIFIIFVAGAFAVSACRFFCRNKHSKVGEYSSIVGQLAVPAEVTTNGSVVYTPHSSERELKYNDSKVPLLQSQDHEDNS